MGMTSNLTLSIVKQLRPRKAFELFKQTNSLRSLSSVPQPLETIPGKYGNEEPVINIKTEIPGPKGQEVRKNLMSIQEMGTVTLISDLAKSKGNYLTDVDGNTFLDCFMQIATLPLGYNHQSLIDVVSNPDNIVALANRPAMPWFPNEEWVNLMQGTMLAAAPKNLNQIYPMMCGSCSNENGIKLIFMKYMDKMRDGRAEFTKEELETSMSQEEPGVPKLCILSFKGGFHGRTIGLLSCSNSRPLHGVDIPQLNWPKADFPRYKYPLEENVRENDAEDVRCLANVEEHIHEQKKKGIPVAGILVEPIQAEGGDHHGSKKFFQGLEKICLQHDISFMMDEVQTGGGSTGKMWCHEYFDLENGPDIVTFAKKMFSGGIYHNLAHRPRQSARIMNTWVGDPHKVLMLKELLSVIQRDRLLELNQQSGKILLNGLVDINNRIPGFIESPRGLGTFCAVDCDTVGKRDKIILEMRKNGVLIGGCGEKTIRLRPALIFGPLHAHLFLEKLESVIKQLK